MRAVVARAAVGAAVEGAAVETAAVVRVVAVVRVEDWVVAGKEARIVSGEVV